MAHSTWTTFGFLHNEKGIRLDMRSSTFSSHLLVGSAATSAPGTPPSSLLAAVLSKLCSDKGMRIVFDIEEEDIERIVKSLDNQHAYLRSRDREDSGYKRLAELFRGFLKRGPGQAGRSSR